MLSLFALVQLEIKNWRRGLDLNPRDRVAAQEINHRWFNSKLEMVERAGFEPANACADRFTVCCHWPLGHLSTYAISTPLTGGQIPIKKLVILDSHSESRISGVYLPKLMRSSSPLGSRMTRNKTKMNGAGEGNRTLTASLEGWNSTVELHPQNKTKTPGTRYRSCPLFA